MATQVNTEIKTNYFVLELNFIFKKFSLFFHVFPSKDSGHSVVT